MPRPTSTSLGTSCSDEVSSTRMFMGTVVGRMDDNEAIFKCILDDEEFRQMLMDWYAAKVYRRAREGGSGAE